MATDIKIVTKVVNELPTERPLVTGEVYKVKQPNGDLLTYTVNSAGEPVFERGIDNEEKGRLDQLTQTQITKLTEGYSKSQIDQLNSDTNDRIDTLSAGFTGKVKVSDPAPTTDGIYRASEAGTYTNLGGLVAEAGYTTDFERKSGVWSIFSKVSGASATGNVVAGDNNAVSGDKVFNNTKPLYDITELSPNLSDNIFQLGYWQAPGITAATSTNLKRLPSITITSDMVGFHTISGYGVCSTSQVRIGVKSNTGVIQLMIVGKGSADDLAPITFEITSDMIGSNLRLTIGIIDGYEPTDGYENHFMWNKGTTALPFSKKGFRNIKSSSVLTSSRITKGSELPISSDAVIRDGIILDDLIIGTGKNLFNKNELNVGYMNTSGTIGSGNTYRYTEKIKVAGLPNDLFISATNGSSTQNGFRFVTAFDINGAVIPSKGVDAGTNNLVNLYTKDDTVDSIVVTVYANVINTMQIESGTERTSYEEYITPYVKFIKGYATSSNNTDTTPDSPLYNSQIIKLGDSIMRASGYTGFVESLADKYNMGVIDYSVGGATITYNGNGVNDIVRQVDNAITENRQTDYIVINGYTNDIISSRNLPLGSISTLYDSPLDTSTFTGSLEYIIKSLKNNWPEAKILYVIVHKMSSRPFDRQETWGQRIREVMRKWSIPIVDIYNEGQLNSYLPVMRDLYTHKADGAVQGDSTHPNTLGYSKFYYPIFENVISNI